MNNEILLISLVEMHPNIYSKVRKDYKDARAKENSWEEIAGAMNESVSECMRQWKNLRERYSRERRAAKITASGAAASQSAWSLFNCLAFLEKHIKPRKTTSNTAKTIAEMKVVSLSCDLAYENTVAPDTAPIASTSATTGSPAQSVLNMSAAALDRTTGLLARTPRSTSKKRNMVDVDAKFMSTLDAIASALKPQSSSSDEAFGRYIIETLKDLPPNKKSRGRQQIHRILEKLMEDSDNTDQE